MWNLIWNPLKTDNPQLDLKTVPLEFTKLHWSEKKIRQVDTLSTVIVLYLLWICPNIPWNRWNGQWFCGKHTVLAVILCIPFVFRLFRRRLNYAHSFDISTVKSAESHARIDRIWDANDNGLFVCPVAKSRVWWGCAFELVDVKQCEYVCVISERIVMCCFWPWK